VGIVNIFSASENVGVIDGSGGFVTEIVFVAIAVGVIVGTCFAPPHEANNNEQIKMPKPIFETTLIYNSQIKIRITTS
jgi:hypothetical protein